MGVALLTAPWGGPSEHCLQPCSHRCAHTPAFSTALPSPVPLTVPFPPARHAVPAVASGSAQQGEGARCRARSFSKVLFGANLFQASYWCSARDVSKGPCLLKELNGSCLQGQKLGCSKQGEGSTLLQREGLCLDFPVPVRHTQTREQLMAEGLPQMLLKPYANPPI